MLEIFSISYPELMEVGFYLFIISLVFLSGGIFLFFKKRTLLAWTFTGIFLQLLVLSFISFDDTFCIAGYIAYDDECAWE
ncbi:MAG: MAGE domain-containing protein [Spirochaetia bacterium]|nr:MAGE domain-containing protein [Spirochaetia bacterium]